MDKKTFAVKQRLGAVIDQARKDRDLTIREIAMKAGIQHPQYVRVTKGSINYTIDSLLRILDTLDLEITLTKKDGL